jgi:hypothetical protein
VSLLNQARPAKKSLRDIGSFVETELVQVENLKRQAEFLTQLFLGDDRRARIVWFAGIAGEDQAATTRNHIARYGRGVLPRRVATHGVVATPVEKECEGAAKVGQVEHVGDGEMRLDASCAGALFRLLHRAWSHVDTRYIEALLSEPDTVCARSAAQLERATGLNGVLTESSLQLSGRLARVPREIAVPIAVVPWDGFCHG